MGGIALPEVGRGGGGGDRPDDDDDDTRPEPCALGKVEVGCTTLAPATGLSGGSKARLVAGGATSKPSGGLLKVMRRRTSTRGCLANEAGASLDRLSIDDDDDEDDVGLATTTVVGGDDEVGSEDDATTTTGGDAG